MAIFFGDTEILNIPQIKFGNTDVQEVYWGGVKIWPAGPQPTWTLTVDTPAIAIGDTTIVTVTDANALTPVGTVIDITSLDPAIVSVDAPQTVTFITAATTDTVTVRGVATGQTTISGLEQAPVPGASWAVQTVDMDVMAAPPPICVDDSYVTEFKNGVYPELTVSAANGVLGNDNPNGGGALGAATVTVQPTLGALTLNANGSFEYVPDGTGTDGQVDTFEYVASNNAGTCTGATVSIVYEEAADNTWAGGICCPVVPAYCEGLEAGASKRDPFQELVGTTVNSTTIWEAINLDQTPSIMEIVEYARVDTSGVTTWEPFNQYTGYCETVNPNYYPGGNPALPGCASCTDPGYQGTPWPLDHESTRTRITFEQRPQNPDGSSEFFFCVVEDRGAVSGCT